ncbi:MAG: hypothetical protein R3C16_07925 [Hyphomonadaceae bacterium]
MSWEVLLNRAGTTFRALPEKDKADLHREEGDRADAGAALDDQAPCARRGRQARRGFQSPDIYAGVFK